MSARRRGSWDDDRPPARDVLGRVRLTAVGHFDRASPERVVREASWPMATVNSDEWWGYVGPHGMGRRRVPVCHAEREWARDNDGDGVR